MHGVTPTLQRTPPMLNLARETVMISIKVDFGGLVCARIGTHRFIIVHIIALRTAVGALGIGASCSQVVADVGAPKVRRGANATV